MLDVLPESGFRPLESAPGVSVNEVRKAAESKLVVEGVVPEMRILNL